MIRVVYMNSGWHQTKEWPSMDLRRFVKENKEISSILNFTCKINVKQSSTENSPLKNISQLGWLFPIYGKIKVMFQTTNQIGNMRMERKQHKLRSYFSHVTFTGWGPRKLYSPTWNKARRLPGRETCMQCWEHPGLPSGYFLSSMAYFSAMIKRMI